MPLLTPPQIDFVERRRVAHFATIDAAGQPHVVPICFAVLEGAVYTAIDEKPKRVEGTSLRRVRNILTRPEVCLVWDHYEEDWSRLVWIQVRGTAALVEGEDERAAAFAALRRRYPQYRAMALETKPLIRIAPASVRSWSPGRDV